MIKWENTDRPSGVDTINKRRILHTTFTCKDIRVKGKFLTFIAHFYNKHFFSLVASQVFNFPVLRTGYCKVIATVYFMSYLVVAILVIRRSSNVVLPAVKDNGCGNLEALQTFFNILSIL